MEANQNFCWYFFAAGFGFLFEFILPLHPLLKKHDLVAQSVEHLTFNQGVMGSSPIEITTQRANYLINRMLALFLFGRGSNCGSLSLSIIKN